ncbi:hypothetical protein D3C86_2083930 [compost metagenome]
MAIVLRARSTDCAFPALVSSRTEARISDLAAMIAWVASTAFWTSLTSIDLRFRKSPPLFAVMAAVTTVEAKLTFWMGGASF